MPPRHDPGLEGRTRGIRRKDDEGLVLEDDPRTDPALVLQRPAEDARRVRQIKTARAFQLVSKGWRLESNRIELRVWVLERGAGRAAVVIEDQHVLERGIHRVVLIAVDVGPDDLLDLAPRQRRLHRPVIRTTEQDLAGTDRVALPETAFTLLLPVRFQSEVGVEVRDDPDRPT